MTQAEINTCAENVINDIYGYADLHAEAFGADTATLELMQEISQRIDEHITDLKKKTSKMRQLDAAGDDARDARIAA